MHTIAREILIKAAEGDIDSFEMIYREFSRFVYNVSLRVVNNQHEAEEVAQEVFLTIYHKLKSFRFQSSFATWVYRVTFNCALNHAKKLSRENTRMVEFDERIMSEEFSAKPKFDMDREHHETKIRALLETINPDQRACVVLRNIEGFSYEQIAQALGININTVRSRLKRARETLLASRNEVIKNEL